MRLWDTYAVIIQIGLRGPSSLLNLLSRACLIPYATRYKKYQVMAKAQEKASGNQVLFATRWAVTATRTAHYKN